MTHLRLLAPVAVDFGTTLGVASRDPEGYAELWRSARKPVEHVSDLPAGTKVALHHTEVVRSTLYDRLDKDSLPRPLHVLTVTCDADTLGHEPVAHATIVETEMRLYDHGIALLEIGLDVAAPPAGAPEDWLTKLQEQGVAMAAALAQTITTRVLDPVLSTVRELDPDHEVVEAAASEDSSARLESGLALWVARSLLVDPGDRAMLAHWTKGAIDDESEQARQDLLDGTGDRLVRWLNYAFVDVDGEGAAAFKEDGRFDDQWQGVGYAQVTYAVLDRIDARLATVLAESAAATERWQLEELKEQLVGLSGRAEVAIMDRQQLAKYLTRAVRRHMEEMLSVWDHDGLLQEPVQFKIEACGRRLDDLTARRTARSGVVTDLILLGIGVTSIASTAVAIIEFGRTSASDSLSTGYDLGGSRFTSWFSAQPIDAVLLVSGVISVVLVLLYLYFRRDDRS